MSYQQLGSAMGQRTSLQPPLQTVHFSQQQSPLSPSRSTDSAGAPSLHRPAMPQMLGLGNPAPRAAVQPHVEISDVRDECLTESDARKKLSRYVIVRMEKSSDQGGDQDSWGRAVWFIYTNAGQQETRHRVRRLNRASGRSVADKKSELKTILRCQLDKVREFLQQGDKDCRYEHTLAQLEFEFKGGSGSGSAGGSGIGSGSPERSARSRSRSRRASSGRSASKSAGRSGGCTSILAYFKRAPKADENCLSIWGEQKHAALNVFPYQVQHGVGGPQPLTFQPGPGVRASSHAGLDPNAYVPQFQRQPSLAVNTPLHPGAAHAQTSTTRATVPMMMGAHSSAGGVQTASAKSRADLGARGASYGSTLSDSSASSHDTAETFTSESSDESEIRRSRSVRRKEEARGGVHKRVKMAAGAEGSSSKDKSHGRAESAFDARDVLHALADCIRVEWIRGGGGGKEEQQASRSSGQSSGLGYERAADLPGLPVGALPQAAEDGAFYQFPRWTHHGQAQASVDSGRGQPQFVVRGYLEDQQERQPWMGQPAWRYSYQQQQQQHGRGSDWDHAYLLAGYDSRQSSHYGGGRGGY